MLQCGCSPQATALLFKCNISVTWSSVKRRRAEAFPIFSRRSLLVDSCEFTIHPSRRCCSHPPNQSHIAWPDRAVGSPSAGGHAQSVPSTVRSRTSLKVAFASEGLPLQLSRAKVCLLRCYQDSLISQTPSRISTHGVEIRNASIVQGILVGIRIAAAGVDRFIPGVAHGRMMRQTSLDDQTGFRDIVLDCVVSDYCMHRAKVSSSSAKMAGRNRILYKIVARACVSSFRSFQPVCRGHSGNSSYAANRFNMHEVHLSRWAACSRGSATMRTINVSSSPAPLRERCEVTARAHAAHCWTGLPQTEACFPTCLSWTFGHSCTRSTASTCTRCIYRGGHPAPCSRGSCTTRTINVSSPAPLRGQCAVTAHSKHAKHCTTSHVLECVLQRARRQNDKYGCNSERTARCHRKDGRDGGDISMSVVPTVPRVPMCIGQRFDGASVDPTHLTLCRPSIDLWQRDLHHQGFCTEGHRLSTVSARAFIGGLTMGRSDSAYRHVASLFPTSFCSADMMSAADANSFNEFEQLVALCASLTSLVKSLLENSILCGWSLGSYSVCLLASSVELIH